MFTNPDQRNFHFIIWAGPSLLCTKSCYTTICFCCQSNPTRNRTHTVTAQICRAQTLLIFLFLILLICTTGYWDYILGNIVMGCFWMVSPPLCFLVITNRGYNKLRGTVTVWGIFSAASSWPNKAPPRFSSKVSQLTELEQMSDWRACSHLRSFEMVLKNFWKVWTDWQLLDLFYI